MTTKRNLALIFGVLLSCSVSFATVKFNSLFSDHMVLQQSASVPVWGIASPGEKLVVSLCKQTQKIKADAEGKWMVRFSDLKVGGPFILEAKGTNTVTVNDVYVGDVWLCSGQSNMDMTVAKEDRYWCGVNNEAEEVASANYPEIRFFDVDYTPNMKPQTEAVGKWEVCSPQTVGHESAVAYFYARELYKHHKTPIGLITSAFGASAAETWISKEALMEHPNLEFLLSAFDKKMDKFLADSASIMSAYREKLSKWTGDLAAANAASGDVTATTKSKTPKKPGNPNPSGDQHNPYVVYNGMIAPLIPYTIKGAIWYQGESNTPSVKVYREIMETLVADWRKRWGVGEFPFLYVQLANYQPRVDAPIQNDPFVSIRDAQLKNLSIPNTAMAVAIDILPLSDASNIHPKNKQEIGARLATAARGLVFKENITYMGPIFEKMTIESNKARISFSFAGSGLMVKGDTLKCFAICGSDRNWVKANAVIDGNTIVVSSPEVAVPVAVRYAWAKNPPANLYNKEGLPASPFKTDED